MRFLYRVLALGTVALPALPAFAQVSDQSDAPAQGSATRAADVESLSAELEQARSEIRDQRRLLQSQEARLRALEARLGGSPPSTAAIPTVTDTQVATVNPPQSSAPSASVPSIPGTQPAPVDTAAAAPVERVGEGPAEITLSPVSVLGEQGSVVTQAGRFTVEGGFEYARADRNRAIFRGIEIVESVLVGVFDINESRQDVLTASAGVRYGISDRFEVGVRLPYIFRSDNSVLAPVQGSGPPEATVDSSTKANGIGDVELSARYQLIAARPGSPFLIANLQVVAPTGSNPFEVPRDANGRALEAATGSGFWGISPSITAILPTDPAVLFGTFGYTYNFGESVNTLIPPVIIERVNPGESLSASLGIGVSLNQRTSFNLGYAHSWAFGTQTRTRLIEDGPDGPLTVSTSRDLQLGRLLFGVSYRLNNRANLNWTVEVGATEDATDLRTVLRIPIVL